MVYKIGTHCDNPDTDPSSGQAAGIPVVFARSSGPYCHSYHHSCPYHPYSSHHHVHSCLHVQPTAHRPSHWDTSKIDPGHHPYLIEALSPAVHHGRRDPYCGFDLVRGMHCRKVKVRHLMGSEYPYPSLGVVWVSSR